MESIIVDLPETLKTYVNEQARSGGYSSAEEYIRAVMRDAIERDEQSRIEALLHEGLDSGSAIEISDEYWQDNLDRLIHQRLERSRKYVGRV